MSRSVTSQVGESTHMIVVVCVEGLPPGYDIGILYVEGTWNIWWTRLEVSHQPSPFLMSFAIVRWR